MCRRRWYLPSADVAAADPPVVMSAFFSTTLGGAHPTSVAEPVVVVSAWRALSSAEFLACERPYTCCCPGWKPLYPAMSPSSVWPGAR
jgi:hypothetical protein